MNILLLGPQGSGKGTQAELLIKNFGFNHFEAGKVLRSIATSTNPNAITIRETLDKGGLVPDEFVRLIAWDYISKHDKTHGFLFDGYPRSVFQYNHLKDMLARFGQKIDLVIDIEITEAETIKRLSSRRICTKCGEVYNLLTNPPKTEHCDKCGGELILREDDTPTAIQRRLGIYRAQTHPVFVQAQAEGVGVEIDGMRSIEAIYADIAKLIHAED